MPSSPKTTDAVVGVAVPVPGLGLLSYRVRGLLDAPPPKGARVVVPLGTRRVTGIVVSPVAEAPAGADLRDVHEVIDHTPFLPETVVDLALWVGDYYASGPGDALAVAMPPGARQGTRTTFRTVRVATLVPTASGEPQSATGVKQQQALALLRAQPSMSLPELQRQGIGADTIKSLEKRGILRLDEQVSLRDPFEHAGGEHADRAMWTIGGQTPDGRELTDQQTSALDSLDAAAAARGFKTVLLHGVTGSGKTEIYLRLAARVVASARRVLVLVPEIALTPAVAGLFHARFGRRVAIQHSGLSDGERHDQWHRIRGGDIDVVVGTRSAVFAPLDDIGLIIVDEEHESSYKQEESPRYHGRDVAVMRGRMAGALVVLGSATPSLESAANAKAGRYDLIALTRRVLDRPLATVRIVDMRREFASKGADVILSEALVEGIGDRLSRAEQTVVLLNRRGFATVVFCRQCGSSLQCPHCSVQLTYHRAARRVRCHYCNYAAAVPRTCGDCGGAFLEQSGFGTERLEAELRDKFPGARISRVDRDTVRRRGAIAGVLRSVARGDVDILVGTQMVAKGHDFPAVTLVGVVSADVGLGHADFRAAERTFQLLTQVVGRAGRGETPGEAIVQTLYPDHYSVRAAAAQDYASFFTREMEFRSSMRYPPSVGLINVIVRGRALDAAMTDALDLVMRVKQQAAGGQVLGPAPAPLSKIKDEYRAQFFLKGSRRSAMRAALTAALEARPDLKRRVTVDVDPISVT